MDALAVFLIVLIAPVVGFGNLFKGTKAAFLVKFRLLSSKLVYGSLQMISAMRRIRVNHEGNIVGNKTFK